MKKRIFALLLAVVMVFGLTACTATLCSTSLNSDGSGVLSLRYGLTQEALELVASTAGNGTAWTDVLDSSRTVPFTQAGVTYYGISEQHAFANLDEFTQLIKALGDSSDVGYVVNADGLSLAQNKADGSFALSVSSLCDKNAMAAVSSQLIADGIDKSKLDGMADQMAMEFSFTFPTAVVQTSGSNTGVKISGNTVTLDAMKLNGACRFSTSAQAVAATPGPFSDVAIGTWYCEAITALSNGGLVNGVGDGTFLPMDSMTYSQFCQIIAKAKGLANGSENGYWATKAIRSCLDGGFITSLGEITVSNYDVPISRETAVAGIMRAVPKELLAQVVESPVIPDKGAISPEFQAEVVEAYRYGVAHGTASDGTFNPKGTLSRAEICQLLYNIGWTSPSR